MEIDALFLFGLVKPLKYLPGEDTWRPRFLAPPDVNDGTHTGATYREAKPFIIVSQPPVVRAKLEKTQYHRAAANQE